MTDLKKRAADLLENAGKLPATKPTQPHPKYGYRSIEGEQHQFRGRQQGLKNRLNDFSKSGCGDPPPSAWDWATRDVPSEFPVSAPAPAPTIDPNAAAKTGLLLAIGYGAYRVIRMIPSLFPPLWPTIPANAAIP